MGNISAAEYFIDSTEPSSFVRGIAMSASDGAFNQLQEMVTAVINISELADGQHTVLVRGRDAVGNWGATKSATFIVDRSPPDIASSLDGAKFAIGATITIDWNVQDPESGILSESATIDGSPVNKGDTKLAGADLSVAKYTLTVTAANKVNLTTTKDFVFEIDCASHGSDGIYTYIQGQIASGGIKNARWAKSLIQKLRNADKTFDRGNTKSGVNMLGALIKELQASGLSRRSQLTPLTASILIKLIQSFQQCQQATPPSVAIEEDFVKHPVIPAFEQVRDIKVTVSGLLKGDTIEISIGGEAGTATLESALVDKQKRAVKNGKVTIDGNDNNKNITLSINGIKANTTPKNSIMLFNWIKQDKTQQNLPEQKFTVFEVELTALTSGEIPEEPKNADDPNNVKKLEDFVQGTFPDVILGHNINLTQGYLDQKTGLRPIGFATNVILIKGKILPSGLNPDDFENKPENVKAKKGFDFKRTKSNRSYLDNCFLQATRGGNINDDGGDDDGNDKDEDLYAGRDGSQNDLFIYVIDSPGETGLSGKIPTLGGVLRDRINFIEHVKYNGKRASKDLKWSSALSVRRTANGFEDFEDDKTRGKDNRLGTADNRGEINLTVDFEKPANPVKDFPFNPQLPFKVAGVQPNEVSLAQQIQNNPQVTFTISADSFPNSAPELSLSAIDVNNATNKKIKLADIKNPIKKQGNQVTVTFDFSDDKEVNLFDLFIEFAKEQGKPCSHLQPISVIK